MASRNNDGDTPAHVLADIDNTELLRCIHEKIESSPPFYHESQKVLAQKIIERIRLIFKHHHEGQLLEDFKDFDFQIYTSRNNTLKEQTKSRLLNPESGCIPPGCPDASKFADERVQLYQLYDAEKKQYAKLKKDAKDNPKKLFLIVADEAHWGITGADEKEEKKKTDEEKKKTDEKEKKKKKKKKKVDEKEKKKAHDHLINTWHDPFETNVIVLKVTATAYNLLTEESSLPLDIFCVESLSNGNTLIVKAKKNPDCETERLMKDDEDVTDSVGPKVPLHHIKWTEIHSSRLEKGMKMVMRTLATSSDAKGGKPIYIGPQPDGHPTCVPLIGHELISDDLSHLTLLFKGRNGRVKIYDAKHRQLKVVQEQGQQYRVVFVPPEADTTQFNEFEMVLSFGEDIFALYPICSDRLSLYYDQDTKTIEVHRKPPTSTLGNEILIELPVTDLFFIHHYENDSSNNYRYISLNHYYNTIWHQDVDSRKIRCDDSFEKLCKEMLRDNRERPHEQTDLFIAEYCIFVICLSEFKNLFTSNSDPYDKTKGVMKEIIEKVGEIEKKLTAFNEELQKTQRIYNENFVDREVIEDVLEYHKPVKGNGHESMVNKWKNVLQACLFGNSKLTKELAEELGQNPDSLEILRTWKNEVINSYETGKIIAELMQITLVGCHLCVIKVNKIDKADKLFSSLELAQDIANKDSTFLFDVVRNYGEKELRHIYNAGDKRKYKLHLLLQSKRCQNKLSDGGFCECEEYTSRNKSIKCKKCDHHHNPMAKCEDLEGLPAILILVDKGKMGDTFPTNFKSMDLRIRCPDRKKEGVATPDKNYVLSSAVQELGRLCRYHKEDDLENVPYALVPESTIDFLKTDSTGKEKDQGNALIYSCFKSIDRYTKNKKEAERKKTTDGDQQKTLKPTRQSCERSSEKSKNEHKNTILLDAEPQCGKTGTFCNVIAELRKLIRQEVSPSDIDENPEEESDDEHDEYEDAEVKWQYPYHEQMSSEQLTKKVGASEKYTPIHGFWSPGKAPTKRPAFQAPWSQTSPSQEQESVSTCHVPYKAESYNHECSDCDEKGITAAPDVYDLVIDSYEIKIHVTTENQSPHLLAKIVAANIQYTPQIPHPDPEPSSADPSTWIFTPTAGRAKSACLNLKHTMTGPRSNDDNTEVFKTYVQVLVVQEKDFEEYCAVWGSKVTAVLQLPSSMEDDGGQSVSAVEGGIGYSRRFIHLFAKVLGLDRIFMIDDRVWFFKEAQFEKDRVKRNEDNVEFECVPLYKVLSHMERQFHRDTPRPRTDFDPYQSDNESDPQTLSELEKYTGPSRNYAVLGVRQYRPGSERVRKPFKKACVYSLFLLNVKSTSEKEITFQPWEAFEDIDFNHRSDEKGLWVCKYNRFLKFTKRVHRAPVIFFWNDEMELTLNEGHSAENEVQRLADWMAFHVKPARKYLLEGASQNTKLRELFQKVKAEKHARDAFFICIDPLNIETDDLKDAIEMLSKKSKVKAQLNLYVISVPVEICLQHSLRKVEDFRRLFENIFEEGFTLQIATSHNVKEFKVEIVLIFVCGKEMADGADTAGIEDGLRDLSLGNQDGAESADTTEMADGAESVDTTEMADGADMAAIEDDVRHLSLEN